MIRLCRNVIETARADHAARRALVWECVALRHQLAVLERLGTRRPRFRPIDRLFWVFMSWWWPAWRDALVVIQPETVLRWHRHGIALIWKYRWHGRWRGGRPRIAVETRQLIRETARANFLWGAPRIHGELFAGYYIAIYAALAERPSLTGVADLYRESRDGDGPKPQFRRAQLGS
jgi:hypothetical protein